VIANNTIDGLTDQETSTYAGRLFIAQGWVSNLLIEGNANLRAGPGDAHSDMNQGEQVLWETGNDQFDAYVQVDGSFSEGRTKQEETDVAFFCPSQLDGFEPIPRDTYLCCQGTDAG